MQRDRLAFLVLGRGRPRQDEWLSNIQVHVAREVAHDVAFDIFRRSRAIAIDGLGELARLGVLEEKPNAAESARHDQKLEWLHEAIRLLRERRQQELPATFSLAEGKRALTSVLHRASHEIDDPPPG